MKKHKDYIIQIDNQDISGKKYYMFYTVAFFFFSIIIFSFFWYNGKSFVFCDTNQGGDGLVQHYNSFLYFGRYIREIVKTVVLEHQLKIPMFDLSIGYGQDVITTLSYYVIGDPFAFVSVFFPAKYAEIGYCIAILLRYYFAGITFSMYCRYRQWKNFSVLIGSLIYVFSFYALVAGVMHPYFLLPMIFLPVVLIGVEKLLVENKKIYYIISLALAGVSNFYFFYMICIIIVLYTISRYIEVYTIKNWKHLVKKVGVFLWTSVYAVCLASVLLLPSVLSILKASRVSVKNYVPVAYKLSDYLKVIPAFINGGFPQYTYMGYSGVGLICAIVLVVRARTDKKYKHMSIRFGVLMCFALIPFGGHIMNGMGYVTNRWIWALSMMVAYCVVVVLSELDSFRNIEWKWLFAIFILGIVIVIIASQVRTEKNWAAMVEFAASALMLMCLHKKDNSGYRWIVCLAVIGVSLFVHAQYLYSPLEENYVSRFVDAGNAYNMMTKDSPEYILRKQEDDLIYRFDIAGIDTGDAKRNSAMLMRMYGVPYYYSTTNEKITQFISDLAMNYSMDQTYINLDRRSILENVFGVKYIVVPKGKKDSLPYGYNEKVKKNHNYVAYSSDMALSLGFTSSNLISESMYQNLSEIEKQEALIQGIVVPDRYANKSDSLTFNSEYLNYEIESASGINVEKDKIIVTDTSAQLKLKFKNVKDKELYLIFRGLSFEGRNPLEIYSTEQLDDMTTLQKNMLKQKYSDWDEPTTSSIAISSGTDKTNISLRTWKDNYYCAHTDFMANLGFDDSERNTIVMKFSQIGTYSFDEMLVATQSMEKCEEYIASLKENVLENCKVGIDEISGTIELKDAKMLCLQIPFDDNWKVVIDGVEQNCLLVDQVFLGTYLEPGKHDISFKYSNRSFTVSAFVSMMAAIIMIISNLIYGMKRRKSKV